MTRGELVGQLKSQSTWRLVFLSLITFGIYSAHYIKRQTSRLNQHLDAERRISEGLITTILISSYVSAFLLSHLRYLWGRV